MVTHWSWWLALGSRYAMPVLSVGVAAVCFWISPFAWSLDVLSLITQEASSTGLVALALLVLFHAGTFDLSAGALFGLGLVSLAVLYPSMSWLGAVAVAMALCVVASLINGVLAVRIQSALLVTFAMNMVWQRAALVIGGGAPVSPVDTLSSPLAALTWAPVLGLPVSFLLLLMVGLLLDWAFHHWVPARHLLSAGLDDARASLLGIPVNTYRLACFGLSGLAIGAAAVIYFSRIATSSPTSGDGLTFEALAALVIGNGGLHRHAPAPLRVIMVTLCLATVQVALAGVDQGAYWSSVLIGILLLLAMLYGRLTTNAWFRP